MYTCETFFDKKLNFDPPEIQHYWFQIDALSDLRDIVF